MAHIRFFREVTPEIASNAGGKGATLARLHQKGFPVPNGFVIFPSSFFEGRLIPEAFRVIEHYLEELAQAEEYSGTFAVRSSFGLEDSRDASFAGAFETLLNVGSPESIKDAAERVFRSQDSYVAREYLRAKNIEFSGSGAVIVQNMIGADFAGILFTADPVSGDCGCMKGNFTAGLADRLASGEVDPVSFSISHATGAYTGPPAITGFCREFHQLGKSLERELLIPQDIEWAIKGNKVYLLQSRPITTPLRYVPASGQRNDSLRGEFFWSNVNFGEAIPDVMTPFTASAMELGPMAQFIKFNGESAYGTICGRPYLNISVFASIFHALGKNMEEIRTMLDGIANVPEGVDIPLIPASRGAALRVLPKMFLFGWIQKRDLRKMPSVVSINLDWCRRTRIAIKEAATGKELASLWDNKMKPHLMLLWSGLLSTGKHHADFTAALQRELAQLVGVDDASALISGMSSKEEMLASLGPLLCLAKVASGEISETDFAEEYGHRSPHELELSIPRPSERPEWIKEQLSLLPAQSHIERLLQDQQNRFDAALARLRHKTGAREKRIRERIEEVAVRARLREAVRSEYARVFAAWRQWALQAGSVTSVGDDIFYLTLDEALRLLRGEQEFLRYLPLRKETYAENCSNPPYPSVIVGRFDPAAPPFADPQKSEQASLSSSKSAPRASITGSAGSAGCVEGIVRCISSPEQGKELLPGEILVTQHTNIGWTFLFPRAAAIITDVGAPLSHAAIVARELGIPAVVGCGNAFTTLRTGDRVRVDGGRGIVEIL